MGTLVQLPFDSARHNSRMEPEHFWGPLAVLWVGSAARVALALAHREVFETEATLALFCVMLIPLAALRSRRERQAFRRARRAKADATIYVNFAAAKARQNKGTNREFTTRGAM